jgi:hypothetical protein
VQSLQRLQSPLLASLFTLALSVFDPITTTRKKVSRWPIGGYAAASWLPSAETCLRGFSNFLVCGAAMNSSSRVLPLSGCSRAFIAVR